MRRWQCEIRVSEHMIWRDSPISLRVCVIGTSAAESGRTKERPLNPPVIASGDDIRPITSVIVVDEIDSLFVCFKAEIRDGIAQ